MEAQAAAAPPTPQGEEGVAVKSAPEVAVSIIFLDYVEAFKTCSKIGLLQGEYFINIFI